MTRAGLAETARAEALKCWHGRVCGLESNLQPMVELFPKGRMEEFDGCWCAAFVYYCCIIAGYSIPARPEICSISLAGCGAWEELAAADARIGMRGRGCLPTPGDIVIYDRVFEDKPHDHMGIVLEDLGGSILTAEGNIGNLSGIVERPKDERIRCYISLPDGYDYAAGGHSSRPARQRVMPEPIIPMTRALAEELASWEYPKEYGVYNWEKGAALDPLLDGSTYALLNSSEELIGFYQFGAEARIPAEEDAYGPGYTDMGLGLRPDLCGLGLGGSFVLSGMRFAQENLGAERIRLTVAAFNERAVKVYERCGFTRERELTHRATGGKFLVMAWRAG